MFRLNLLILRVFLAPDVRTTTVAGLSESEVGTTMPPVAENSVDFTLKTAFRSTQAHLRTQIHATDQRTTMTKKKAKSKTKTEGVVDLSQLLLGSPAWIEAVYSSGPARSVEGRSRPTQRDMSVSALDKTSDAVEGRLEKIALNLLEWLRNLGLVKRFKYQPFKLDEQLHGVKATPDFLFEDSNGNHHVLEVKSVAFLTADEQEQQDKVKRASQQARLGFIFWTDQWPLSRSVFNIMSHMRRAHNLGITDSEIEGLIQAIRDQPRTLKELRSPPFKVSSDFVFATAYRGKAFWNIFQEIEDHTYVYEHPQRDLLEPLFKGWCRAELVWSALPCA